ncbi:MAG TPA: aspartate aminotransferase family protein, partial [Pseudomonadota bacterium]|nr:aspartate aminotransferase family protein [Pseudomonadota bacterium]
GNPLSVRAGLETLKILEQAGSYEKLDASGAKLAAGLGAALKENGLQGCVNRVGSLLTMFLGVERVTDAQQARRSDRGMFAKFFHAMLDRGIYIPPSQFEAMFVSLSHSEADLDNTIAAARESLLTFKGGPRADKA